MARGAFTLVELLVVMTILLLLAAVTLPSVKGLLKDQRVSQGARVVQGFAESCRARAIATGRPVAMILDRNYLDATGPGIAANDTVTRMTVGEVFPPYQGDWAGAKALITNHLTIPGRQIATIQFAQAASLWNSISSVPSGLVEPDDVIQFGDSAKTYRIADQVFLTGSAPNIFVNIAFENPPIDQRHSRPTNAVPFLVRTGEATIFPQVPVNFRIFRKPSKSLAGSVTLPRGICVDLSVSGSGQSGREFGTESIAGVAGNAGYYGPVFIVFNPSGKVQDLYYHTSVNAVHTGAVRFPAGDVVHLMVGRTDQVFSNPTGYLGAATIPSPAVSAGDDVRYNVLDSSNFWVSINPFSGAVTASQVQDIDHGVPGAGVFLENDRMASSRSLAIHGVQRTDP